MRSVASPGALLKTSTSTVITNSMVVKSSLWSKTRHSLGRLVRVFFSVTTEVSPPSRGFRLAIKRDRTAARDLLNLRAAGTPEPAPFAIRYTGDHVRRGSYRARLHGRVLRVRGVAARARAPVRGLPCRRRRERRSLQRSARRPDRMPRAHGEQLQGPRRPLLRRQRCLVVPGARL